MIFSLPEYTSRIKRELRFERIHHQTLVRTHLLQKKKIEEVEAENKQLKKELEKFKKENEKLKRKIEKITKTNNRYKVSLFDHGNFKQAHDTQNKKQKGGQIGHSNTNPKRNYASFQRKRIFVDACGNCGQKLSQTNATREKILMDIQSNTDILQLLVLSERQWCRQCKKEIHATHPQSLPFTEYGINTLMTVLFLRFNGKQSFATIAITLTRLFGLPISKAAVGTLLTQAKEYLKDTYEELKKAIRDGELMYNDETGWRVRGRSAWMWIMANETTTVYIAAESRGKGIMEAMYGESKAYSMHDGYAGYTNTIPKDKQLYCWAHILRFVHEETVVSKKDSPEWFVKERLVFIYQHIRSHPEESKEDKERFLTKEIDTLLGMEESNEAMKNIQHRLKNQRDGLIRALLVTIDGTNNLAERELRPLAISRNISYGSDTYQGMETTAILASIIQTISREKTNRYFPTLTSYFHDGIQKKYPQYKHSPSFVT